MGSNLSRTGKLLLIMLLGTLVRAIEDSTTGQEQQPQYDGHGSGVINYVVEWYGEGSEHIVDLAAYLFSIAGVWVFLSALALLCSCWCMRRHRQQHVTRRLRHD